MNNLRCGEFTAPSDLVTSLKKFLDENAVDLINYFTIRIHEDTSQQPFPCRRLVLEAAFESTQYGHFGFTDPGSTDPGFGSDFFHCSPSTSIAFALPTSSDESDVMGGTENPFNSLYYQQGIARSGPTSDILRLGIAVGETSEPFFTVDETWTNGNLILDIQTLENHSPSDRASPDSSRINLKDQGRLGKITIHDIGDILRSDYLEYLKTRLPSYPSSDIGSQKQGNTSVKASPASEFQDLRLVYTKVCQLDARMEEDAIYSRIALAKLHLEYLRVYEALRRHVSEKRKRSTAGRGDATCIIDNILQQLHPDWASLSEAQHRAVRNKFHERNRYGKRWVILANGLGKGILLLCSPKMVALVLKTTVTLKQLSGLVDHIRFHHHDVVELLELVRPVGERIYSGKISTSQEIAATIQGVQHWTLKQESANQKCQTTSRISCASSGNMHTY